MRDVQCKNCIRLKSEWCAMNNDSQDPEILRDCHYFKQMTNADRIRAMSDEELAEFICGVYDVEEDHAKYINGDYIPAYSADDIKDWLQQPAEEETI